MRLIEINRNKSTNWNIYFYILPLCPFRVSVLYCDWADNF